jgi:hypothetical protein
LTEISVEISFDANFVESSEVHLSDAEPLFNP